MDASYVLPIRCTMAAEPDLASYLGNLVRLIEVIVVDGSSTPVFEVHDVVWPSGVRHVPPDRKTPNGKVGGVVTGVRLASWDRVIIADEDVRWEAAAIERAIDLLDAAAIVRPQNYFDPLPWHARWDTARTLLNRTAGGDWPGSFAVRRSTFLRAGGYRGDVLFENLEMVRTMQAAGGTMVTPLDLYVRRLPPSARHFLGQRVRQAYDEFARPIRMAGFLTIIPLVGVLLVARRPAMPAVLAATAVSLAEIGRRRAGGCRYFPASSSLLAPAWLLERGICAWLAVAARLGFGGIRYGDAVLSDAASSIKALGRAHTHPSREQIGATETTW